MGAGAVAADLCLQFCYTLSMFIRPWNWMDLLAALLCVVSLFLTCVVLGLPDDVNWIAFPFMLLLMEFFIGAPQIAMLVAMTFTTSRWLKMIFLIASLTMVVLYWFALQDVRRSTGSTAVVALPFISLALVGVSGPIAGMLLAVRHIMVARRGRDVA